MTPARAHSSASGRAAEQADGSRLDLLWIWTCGAATTIVAAILSSAVFGRIPHIQDSVAQLFQARIFAGGHLVAASPPLRQFFDYPHMINDGRWYSQYPPGHSLLLVPGVWLGLPWLINPLLAGLGVAAAGLLARELFGSAEARITGLLGLLSPFLLLMAAEFMSHVSGFALLTFFLLFYFRVLRTGRLREGIAAGACLGWAVLVRPYTAAAVAAPVLMHAAWSLYKNRPDLMRPIACLAAGGATGAVLLGLYQWGTTGDPFLPGYIKLYGPSHGLGFGKGTWGPPHTLLRGLRGAWDNLRDLNLRLWGWPLSSLWPLVAALWPAAALRTESRRGRWILAAVPLCLLLAYVFYWYHDLCFGPRYLYESLGALLVLSAFGLRRLGSWLAGRLVPRASGIMRAAPALVLVAILFIYAFAVSWPAWFRLPAEASGAGPASPQRQASYFQRFSPEYWGVSPYLGRLIAERGLSHALVFLRMSEPEMNFLPMRHLWYGSGFALQDPDLGRANVILAQDLGEEDRQLARLFPDREVYLYSGSIESGQILKIQPEEGGR